MLNIFIKKINYFNILKKLNNSVHYLISSVCISKNGSMIWNHTDTATLTMKQLNLDEIKLYLSTEKEIRDLGSAYHLKDKFNRTISRLLEMKSQ